VGTDGHKDRALHVGNIRHNATTVTFVVWPSVIHNACGVIPMRQVDCGGLRLCVLVVFDREEEV
jgi:hypothetical protein